MLYLFFFFVCFLASVIGAICGIGGGIIIKPLLDAFGVLDVVTVSFLSGCTVLSMTSYSMIKGKLSGDSHIDKKIGFPLAIGAACGGLAGKELFSLVLSLSPDKERVGAIQAICLLIVTAGTLVYTIYKDKIKTYSVKNMYLCAMTGILLGILSSFLGIGGGPINLVFLFFFFSMNMIDAAENSLCIIFFSQLANLASGIATGSVPKLDFFILILMILGGVLGGILGRYYNKKIGEKVIRNLFIGLMFVIIFINLWNIYKFLQ